MNTYRIATPKTVLILGSGGQKIGQSGEFDYAGFHAIRAFKSENIRTILVNPNMAAVQAREHIADAVYFLPVTPEFVEQIIEKERPDSLLVSFGGKEAFNCALRLRKQSVLEKYNIQILGTDIDAISKTDQRNEFINLLKQEGLPVPGSEQVSSFKEAERIASKHGYPVMVRTNFDTENSSYCCLNEQELAFHCAQALSGADSFYVEEWLGGWKEVEFEILRDAMDNCIVACTMENIDPAGIHNGDSAIVIPAQTLTDSELQNLRTAAFRAARLFNIIGEANIRFVLDPASEDFRLIEMAPRISRSSVLASKASGFPIALIASKIMLGFSLSEIDNKLTGSTRYCTEPSFDYCAVKMPRWDTEKFRNVDRHLGAEMKSVGSALAFGKTFEEALQKAVRMANPRNTGIACHGYIFKDIKAELKDPTDLHIFAIYSALREGWSADRIYKYTHINRYFISCLKNILEVETELAASPADRSSLVINREQFARAKRTGFSDDQIACILKTRAEKVRRFRQELNLRPVVKQIDTCSAEYASKSNMLYMTYSGITNDVKPAERGTLIPGSGPYHIGSSLEYDWCAYSALQTCKDLGQYSIMVNCNPEAVSTDFEVSDRLYFEEVSLERILDIYEAERPDGVLLSVGGTEANRLALPLSWLNIPVFGTDPADIDRAENRNKFSALLDTLHIRQPEWTEITHIDEAFTFAQKSGFPVLIRPANVSSEEAKDVAWNDNSLKTLLSKTITVSAEHPVMLTHYEENSKEIEIDAVARNGEILVYAISEHIENAGVHSGDATVVLPAQRIYLSTAQAIKKAARKIAAELGITGPFNIQFLAKRTDIQVIECSMRASRSIPFCSNVFRTDFVDLAVKAQLGAEAAKVQGNQFDIDYVGVKAAQFSYSRLKGADPVAGVEMTSTGEVGCLGRGVRDAFMKAMVSAGYGIPKRKILLSTGPLEDKVDFIDSARKLRNMGYELAASSGTARFLHANGIEAEILAWPLDDKKPNIADAIKTHDIDLVINIPKNNREIELKNDYIIRRMSIDYSIPLITNIKVAKQYTDALEWYKTHGFEIKSREEYRV
ncbi:carbamoyl-phosphate synthase (glutamine-hydrolyzing) large subunit [Brucepastera parasyntrophica]|uniref:carbamoyl-phosphate synthase (glutamine-hydrolyzing) large subunit n=1 Tax=Brucepastera parasyntrophica TaxID=2880008 RepID=UPI00210A63E9|nr:carbamoyl-phosphate synthase (glutamine-hydrolyzing) large subunit [Brucepastera parasyntrophica]ULQ58778.1 carbamoyl-phosphate synthase (glutamine-hydrolyzing) large subunit [Brucepastera parasyntrophica]